VDKTSAQCMYTMTQTRTWSVPHLKAGCWYIEYGKTIFLVEVEEVKISCNKVNSTGAELGSDHIKVLEEENEVDLSLLPEKERNKILNQRTRDAKKAADKAEREATRAIAKALREATAVAEKEAKKAKKSGKSKALTPPLLLTKTSIASSSQNPCKRAASFV
jgi:vacuolar-type H+-ATPase subunit H